jgi:hypothetical protein
MRRRARDGRDWFWGRVDLLRGGAAWLVWLAIMGLLSLMVGGCLYAHFR